MPYDVKADGKLIYSTAVPSHETQLISPTLNLEDSRAGSFEFTLLPTHFAYNDIKRLKTTIEIEKNGNKIWEGRVLTEDDDFYNQRSIYCEGSLSYLNDTRQPQREYFAKTAYQIVESVIDIHNSKVGEDKIFHIGYVPTDFLNDDEYYATQFESSLDVINDIASILECHIKVYYQDGKRYLTIFKEYDTTSTQKIVFGTNLMDFTRSYDMSNLVTALLPLGSKESGTSRNIGDEITVENSEGRYIITTGEALIEITYDDGGVTRTTVMATRVYPDTDVPIPETFHIGWLEVQSGETYFLSARLPKGYDFLFYALKFEDAYRVYEVKESGSGIGYDDITEVQIDIPEGVTSLLVSGDTEFVKLSLYSSTNLPDTMDSYVTVESVNNGSMYVKAEEREVTTYDQYGNPTTITVDPLVEWGYIEKTIEFDDITDPQELLVKAEQYLTDYQFDQLSMEVNAVDMADLGVNVENIDIYQNIRVVSPIHGLDRLFPVTKMKIVLNDPSNNTYTIGTENDTSLTTSTNAIDDELFEKISQVPTTSSILNAAQRNAYTLITTSVGGFVTLIQNQDNDGVEAIVISQEKISGREDLSRLRNYWIWNKNGLAYIDANGQRAALALTSDGKIVADAITTGTMYADRIKGGTLNLGSYDGSTGVLNVRDSGGSSVLYADQNGMSMRSANDLLHRELRMVDGELVGYRNGNPTGYLGLSAAFGFGSGYGTYLTTGVFAIDASDGIYMADPNVGLRQAFDGTINVQDDNGDPIALHFNNGIFMGYGSV